MLEFILRELHQPATAAIAQIAALLLARVLPLVAFSPMLGGQVIPNPMRFGIAAVLVAIFLPLVGVPAGPISTLVFLALLAKEVLVGMILATIVTMMFETFATAGALVDLARGSTIANVLDPVNQQHQSLLGAFMLQLAVVLFLTLGGHRAVIEALHQSLDLLPPTSALPRTASGPVGLALVIDLISHLMVVAVQLAAPVLGVILLVDVGLGLANRVAPSLQVFHLGQTVKSWLGILVFFLGLALLVEIATGEFAHDLENIHSWLRGLSHMHTAPIDHG